MEQPEGKREGHWLEGRTKYILQYALETWYEALQDYTLRTSFVSLSRLQQEAMFALCTPFAKSASLDGINVQEVVSSLSAAQRELVETVVQEIEQAITAFSGQAFVKLSTRSPKDAVTGSLNQRMMNHLNRALEASDGTPNGDSVAFVTATRHAFRVTSGWEAMELMMRSSRIREDLMKVLDLPPDLDTPLNVIVREWRTMQPEMEFRVFVKDRRITAISQYCYYQYFPALVARKEDIQRQILERWEQIKHLIPQEDCVVDFVLLDDEPFIIELNPYFGDTGACLFEWRDPDRKILRGEAPFEFRLLEEAKEDPLGCFPTEWVDYINHQRGRSRLPAGKSGGRKKAVASPSACLLS